MASSKKRSRSRKRSTSSSNPRSYSNHYKNSPLEKSVPKPVAAETPVKAEPKSSKTSSKETVEVDWAGEYGYVMKDLGQLAIVSVSLFVLMLVAGYLI